MTDTNESNNLPPCRILFRSKDGIEVFAVSSNREDVMEKASGDRHFLVKGGTSCQTLAPDGSCAFVLLNGHGIIRVPLDNSTGGSTIMSSNSSPFLQDSATIQMMEISPQGSYLLTWQRATESQPNNLKVWSASTGDFLIGFPQKGLRREAWPYVQWTADETLAFHMTTNEVRIYPGHLFAQDKQEARFIDKVRIPGITTLSVPRERGNAMPSAPYRFTAFVPGDKNKPAKATLHEYSASDKVQSVVTTKSLFQAEDMKTNWSPNGSIALITLQTSVDASGKSYYGSATLFLMGNDDKNKDAKAVPLPQEGPVMDVSWMPNAKQSPCFVVIAGRMPAMASLHHGLTGDPLFLFGNAHRNTISWAPHGRFVCIAGFGNLAGGMSFWDKNKQKLMPPTGQNTASCTVGYGWSPDSRLFGVSTTTPRMNVDNGYRLFRYNGEEVTSVPWTNSHYMPDKLLEACFVPTLPTVYPDRPQSPTLKQADAAGAATASSSSTAPAAEAAAASDATKPAGRYIPPSQRGKQTGGNSLAERMRREKETQMKGAQKVVGQPKIAVSAQTGKVIPGLVIQPQDQGKTKSAVKREKQKLAKQRKEEEEAKRQAEEEATKAAAAATTPAAAAATADGEALDPEKRARKIKKTLKQIDDLKQKDPALLNDDQKQKIESEESLRKELADLGL